MEEEKQQAAAGQPDAAAQQKKKPRLTDVLAGLCFVLALTLALSSAGATLARYVAEDSSQGMAIAAPFYFSSDKLSDAAPVYAISEPQGSEQAEISFDLYNYVDDLRRTGVNISYTITVYRGVGTAGTELRDKGSSGTLSGSGRSEQAVSILLDRSDFGGETGVTVVARASAPYEKTISASFQFTPQGGESLTGSLAAQDNALVLTISGGSGSTVTVTWPVGLTPDASDSIFAGASGNSVSFTADAGVRYALNFLRSDPGQAYVLTNPAPGSFAISVSGA